MSNTGITCTIFFRSNMAFVPPDYVYTILLACVMGACSTEDDCNNPQCICKPAMYVEQMQPPPAHLQHHICNNATFDWLVHTMLAEIASQKDQLASNREVLSNLQLEVQAYEHSHITMKDHNQQLQVCKDQDVS